MLFAIISEEGEVSSKGRNRQAVAPTSRSRIRVAYSKYLWRQGSNSKARSHRSGRNGTTTGLVRFTALFRGVDSGV